MTTTSNKTAASSRPLRQSRLDFSKAPSGTQGSPLTSSYPSSRTRSSARTGSSGTSRSSGSMLVHKRTTTRSSNSKPSAHFLGASTRKKQTYLEHLSSDDDDAVIVPIKSSNQNQVDSENLLGRRFGAFVFDETESEDGKDDGKRSDDDEDEDDIPARSSASRKRKRPTTFVVDDDEESAPASEADSESDSDVAVTTPRKKSRSSQRRDEDDLADDLEFLRSSPPAVTPRGTKSKKDERSRALEELKRQREKRKPKADSSSQKRQKMVVLDSDDEESRHSKASAQSDDSNEDLENASDLDEVHAYEVFDQQEDDQEFIEDDEGDDEGGGRLGVPTSSIPIAFTSWATAKPRELFRFGVEWFVQKKLNPAFSRDDEIFQLTWQKLNDEITGLVGSKFTSSAWNRDFTFSLQSRPTMKKTRVEAIMQDCEACNRTGHPATWQVQFLGAPYDTQTYEDVEQDSEDEEEGTTRDQRGHKIPPESRVYSMGATCFKNANIAHSLKHWRWSLGQWVLQYLEEIGELTDDKIVERDRWKEVKRRKYAEMVVQRMEDEGEVQSLYRTMKGEVNSARGSLEQY